MLQLRSSTIALSMIGVLVFSSSSLGHSGRLNSQGCHGGSQPYHCHRSASEMVPSSSGGSRLKCSQGSSSKDCLTSVNSSSSKTDYSTTRLQMALVRHCEGLNQTFVDGLKGPKTVEVLKIFQQAYGLDADGVVGKNTNRALQGPVNGRCAV